MALLQNDKAIFYHPLDNSTESLQAQAWTIVSGDFPAGKVSQGLAGVFSGTLAPFGTEAEFLSAGVIAWSAVAVLSATSFVVVYRDESDGSHGTAKIGTVSGTDITFGAETEFLSTGSTTYNSVGILSATQFIIAYSDSSDTNHGTAKVGTVSGTDITFGVEAEFNSAGQTNFISMAVLSATQFVVVYSDNSDSNHGTAKVGTVSGTTITFGAESEFSSAGTTIHISVAVLSATTFVVAYEDVPDAGHGTAKIGTVSGTDITFGAESEFNSAGVADHISVTILSATKFIVAYRDGSDAAHGTAKVGTVTGTTITFGAEAEFLSANGASFNSVAAISPTTFIVVYNDEADSQHGTAKVGTVTGTTIAFSAEVEFLSALGASYNSVAAIDLTTFVVAYADGDDSSHGTAKVGTLSFGASLTASTPAAYDSAAGGTNVAFACWLKNPSA